MCVSTPNLSAGMAFDSKDRWGSLGFTHLKVPQTHFDYEISGEIIKS